jgi:hypothetical protein
MRLSFLFETGAFLQETVRLGRAGDIGFWKLTSKPMGRVLRWPLFLAVAAYTPRSRSVRVVLAPT